MSSYSTMTGTEFNKQMAGTKMYKVLNKNLTHQTYLYEPNALNSLDKTGETFNPDPDCGPGGLYFCAESDILKWVRGLDCLIAPVEIPDNANAQISTDIGDDEFKTNMLILGEPVTVVEFCSKNTSLNLSVSFLNEMDFWFQMEWVVAKDMYTLVPNIFDHKLKAKLLFYAIIHYETKLFLAMMEDMQKMQEWSQIEKELMELLAASTKPARLTIAWFRMQIPQYAMLFRQYSKLFDV